MITFNKVKDRRVISLKFGDISVKHWLLESPHSISYRKSFEGTLSNSSFTSDHANMCVQFNSIRPPFK